MADRDFYRHACLILKSKINTKGDQYSDLVGKLQCEQNDIFNNWINDPDGSAAGPHCPLGIDILCPIYWKNVERLLRKWQQLEIPYSWDSGYNSISIKPGFWFRFKLLIQVMKS